MALIYVSSSNAQNELTKTIFLEKWENSKVYLMEIAETMPENHYDYAPTLRQMTFKAQVLHITKNMNWLSTTYFEAKKLEAIKENATKAEVIAFLNLSFDRVAQAIIATDSASFSEKVDFFAGEKIKLQILNLLQDHVTHHRGQLIVYLNLKELTPPKYTGW